jgi:uridine kinase
LDGVFVWGFKTVLHDKTFVRSGQGERVFEVTVDPEKTVDGKITDLNLVDAMNEYHIEGYDGSMISKIVPVGTEEELVSASILNAYWRYLMTVLVGALDRQEVIWGNEPVDRGKLSAVVTDVGGLWDILQKTGCIDAYGLVWQVNEEVLHGMIEPGLKNTVYEPAGEDIFSILKQTIGESVRDEMEEVSREKGIRLRLSAAKITRLTVAGLYVQQPDGDVVRFVPDFRRQELSRQGWNIDFIDPETEMTRTRNGIRTPARYSGRVAVLDLKSAAALYRKGRYNPDDLPEYEQYKLLSPWNEQPIPEDIREDAVFLNSGRYDEHVCGSLERVNRGDLTFTGAVDADNLWEPLIAQGVIDGQGRVQEEGRNVLARRIADILKGSEYEQISDKVAYVLTRAQFWSSFEDKYMKNSYNWHRLMLLISSFSGSDGSTRGDSLDIERNRRHFSGVPVSLLSLLGRLQESGVLFTFSNLNGDNFQPFEQQSFLNHLLVVAQLYLEGKCKLNEKTFSEYLMSFDGEGREAPRVEIADKINSGDLDGLREVTEENWQEIVLNLTVPAFNASANSIKTDTSNSLREKQEAMGLYLLDSFPAVRALNLLMKKFIDIAGIGNLNGNMKPVLNFNLRGEILGALKELLKNNTAEGIIGVFVSEAFSAHKRERSGFYEAWLRKHDRMSVILEDGLLIRFTKEEVIKSLDELRNMLDASVFPAEIHIGTIDGNNESVYVKAEPKTAYRWKDLGEYVVISQAVLPPAAQLRDGGGNNSPFTDEQIISVFADPKYLAGGAVHLSPQRRTAEQVIKRENERIAEMLREGTSGVIVLDQYVCLANLPAVYLGIALVEVLKNAFVHGGADFSNPLILSVGTDKKEFFVYNQRQIMHAGAPAATEVSIPQRRRDGGAKRERAGTRQTSLDPYAEAFQALVRLQEWLEEKWSIPQLQAASAEYQRSSFFGQLGNEGVQNDGERLRFIKSLGEDGEWKIIKFFFFLERIKKYGVKMSAAGDSGRITWEDEEKIYLSIPKSAKRAILDDLMLRGEQKDLDFVFSNPLAYFMIKVGEVLRKTDIFESSVILGTYVFLMEGADPFSRNIKDAFAGNIRLKYPFLFDEMVRNLNDGGQRKLITRPYIPGPRETIAKLGRIKGPPAEGVSAFGFIQYFMLGILSPISLSAEKTPYLIIDPSRLTQNSNVYKPYQGVSSTVAGGNGPAAYFISGSGAVNILNLTVAGGGYILTTVAGARLQGAQGEYDLQQETSKGGRAWLLLSKISPSMISARFMTAPQFLPLPVIVNSTLSGTFLSARRPTTFTAGTVKTMLGKSLPGQRRKWFSPTLKILGAGSDTANRADVFIRMSGFAGADAVSCGDRSNGGAWTGKKTFSLLTHFSDGGDTQAKKKLKIDPVLFDEAAKFILKDYDRMVHTGVYVVGVAGGAGVGKTTFAVILKQALEIRGKKVMVRGIDEFIKSKKERIELENKEWDEHHVRLSALRSFMRSVKSGEKKISRIKYVRSPEPGLREDTVDLAGVDIVILEGIYALVEENRLGNIVEFMDFPIYMEARREDMKNWRFEQEFEKASPRSLSQMERHWREGILPDLSRNILPSKANAVLVIHVDLEHNMELEIVPGNTVPLWRDGGNEKVTFFSGLSNETRTFFFSGDSVSSQGLYALAKNDGLLAEFRKEGTDQRRQEAQTRYQKSRKLKMFDVDLVIDPGLLEETVHSAFGAVADGGHTLPGDSAVNTMKESELKPWIQVWSNFTEKQADEALILGGYLMEEQIPLLSDLRGIIKGIEDRNNSDFPHMSIFFIPSSGRTELFWDDTHARFAAGYFDKERNRLYLPLGISLADIRLVKIARIGYLDLNAAQKYPLWIHETFPEGFSEKTYKSRLVDIRRKLMTAHMANYLAAGVLPFDVSLVRCGISRKETVKE